MYSDNTLTPKEAVRLCALGTLSQQTMTYSALAQSVRHFIDRIQGPSLDVLGTSVELLKYEGLVAVMNDQSEQESLQITDKGTSELHALLMANIRSSDSDLNKLIEALKFRFLDFLNIEDQHIQTDLMVERTEVELARHIDLRQHFQNDGGFLLTWLDRDIGELEDRLRWLEKLRDDLYKPEPT